MNRVSGVLLLLSGLVSGCGHTDVILRPERTTFIQSHAEDFKVEMASKGVTLRCLKWDGEKSPGVAKEQCLYFAADEQKIFDAFATVDPSEQTATRNLYTSFLLNLSDQNCSTYLGRAFANKTSFDATKTLTQDLLTGSSAAAAALSAPVAASLSVVNLMVGKGVDNVNSTFFYEKTFQALSTAITAERQIIRAEIQASKLQPYDQTPIYDVLAAVRRYDDACSIRVGLGKLQHLAQETQDAKSELAKTVGAIAILQTQLAARDKELAQLKRLPAAAVGTEIAGVNNNPARVPR